MGKFCKADLKSAVGAGNCGGTGGPQASLTLQVGLSSHGAGPNLVPPPTLTVEGGKALHLWQIF